MANSLVSLEVGFLCFLYLVYQSGYQQEKDSNWIIEEYLINSLLTNVWSEFRGTTKHDSAVAPGVRFPPKTRRGKDRKLLLEN